MKKSATSRFYFNVHGVEVEIWHQEANGEIAYWETINGVSNSLTKKQYENRLKKLAEQQKQFS